MAQLTLWTAYGKNCFDNIITVGAASEADARTEITKQLDREGRREYLARWAKYGYNVKPDKPIPAGS